MFSGSRKVLCVFRLQASQTYAWLSGVGQNKMFLLGKVTSLSDSGDGTQDIEGRAGISSPNGGNKLKYIQRIQLMAGGILGMIALHVTSFGNTLHGLHWFPSTSDAQFSSWELFRALSSKRSLEFLCFGYLMCFFNLLWYTHCGGAHSLVNFKNK